MKKLIITSLKVCSFFILWAVCCGLGDIPSDNPAIWRLGAEAIPLLTIIVFSVIFWRIEKKDVKVISFNSPIQNISIGVGIGILWIGVAVGIMSLTGTLVFTGKNQIENLFIWMTACLLNVIMQELLVRGYIYQLLKKNYNMAVAITITTILFTAMHGGAFEAGIIAVLNVITMSLFMSLVLEYTGSIIAPILLHTIWNGVGAIILGGVSLADDYPHLFNTVFTGNELLSGGSCKLEGSVVVLCLNIVFSVIFFLLINKRKKLNH